jgi:hypothetical protein
MGSADESCRERRIEIQKISDIRAPLETSFAQEREAFAVLIDETCRRA